MKYSGISWTDRTHNFWEGCTEAGPGCDNCYARILVQDRFGRVIWGPSGTRRILGDKYNDQLRSANQTPWVQCMTCGWRGPEARPNGSKRNPHNCENHQLERTYQRVFTLSLGDFFEARADLVQPRKHALELMHQYTNLRFLVLTKRTNRIMPLLDDAIQGDPARWLADNPHVMMGTSVENRQSTWKITELSQIPTAMRWLSLEPLLGDIDLSVVPGIRLMDWGIIGGESGANARPMRYAWAIRGMAHLQANGVTPFFKQWGEWVPAMEITNEDGVIHSEWWVTFNGAKIPWGIWQNGELRVQPESWPTVGGRVADRKNTAFRLGKRMDPCTVDGRTIHDFPPQLI